MTRPRAAVRALVYRTFYKLPHHLRMRIVRLFKSTYTVGSVILVRDSEAPAPGRLLLLRQPIAGGWTIPAGLLDRGETPIEGAVRELFEETGIRVGTDRLRPAVPSAVVHTRGQWVDMVFELAVPAAGTTLAVDGAEVFEAVWHPLDDLPRLTGPTARLLAVYGLGPLAHTDAA